MNVPLYLFILLKIVNAREKKLKNYVDIISVDRCFESSIVDDKLITYNSQFKITTYENCKDTLRIMNTILNITTKE